MPLPEELIAVASDEAEPLASVAVVLAVLPLAATGAAGTPTSAAASACWRSVRALEAGSAAECVVGVSLDSSALDGVVVLPPEVPGVAPALVGVAASD